VYLDGNRSSHFNPLLDSMRIYFVLLRFTFVSLTTAILDNVIFFVALRFFPNVLTSLIIGRIGACMYNYYANKNGVFQSQARNTVALPKYWLSAVVFAALSYALIETLLAYTTLRVIVAKPVAETIMFFFSFVVQRDFVFSKRASESA
jgi:putative flippase GtrA